MKKKSMRKTVLALLLVFAMILGLCSCAGPQSSGGFSGGSSDSGTIEKFNEFASRIKGEEAGDPEGSGTEGGSGSESGDGLEEEVSLIGQWTGIQYYSESRATEILQALQFYDDEIEYAELSGLPFMDSVTFNEDGTYLYHADSELTQIYYRAYLDNFFTEIFNHRFLVSEYVNIQNSATAEEFKEAYATTIFSYENYDELLDAMVEHIDSNYTPQDVSGVYYTEQEYIYMKDDGNTEYDAVQSSISGLELRLVYSYDDGSTSTAYYYK